MTVKVIIDREVIKGKESKFSELLRQLRSKAVSSKGYISGETLRSLSHHQNYIVIGTWQSVDDWSHWERNAERQNINEQIEEIMIRPTKTEICVYA
jgi:heme-degrading monooxygenase HmoA